MLVYTSGIAIGVNNKLMNPLQRFSPIRVTSHRNGLTDALITIEYAIGKPPISVYYYFVIQPFSGDLVDLRCFKLAYLMNLSVDGSICCGFFRSNYLLLVRCSTIPFARLGSTEGGIIHLNQPGQLVVFLAATAFQSFAPRSRRS